MIAALYVYPDGPYSNRDGVEIWDEARDARNYQGPHPVVAHPPCNLWINLCAVNWRRYGKVKPAWYPGGSDGGCFAHALSSLLKFGGVLEHPADSWAWTHYGLKKPLFGKHGKGWTFHGWYWVCEVWQSAYGHQARKRTWLCYVGTQRPLDLNWSREPGTHQIGYFDQNKPVMTGKKNSLSPPAFADALIKLAKWSTL
jgi:hypothetical protein